MIHFLIKVSIRYDDVLDRGPASDNGQWRGKMYRLKMFVFTFLIFIMGWMTPGCTEQAPPEIFITGSTTILPYISKVSEIYSKKVDVRIRISDGGSIKGISDLIDGKCSIAMSSSPIPTEMFSYAESKGIQIKGFPFADDVIVPIVHPSKSRRYPFPCPTAGHLFREHQILEVRGWGVKTH